MNLAFLSSQNAYEAAFKKLFATLDQLEARLVEGGAYLFGDRVVETDYRLFCTLVRFDVVYFGHFKCNKKRIADYPALQAYLQRIYHSPGVAETVNFDHIKRHYYYTHDDINPTRIAPVGPQLDWVYVSTSFLLALTDFLSFADSSPSRWRTNRRSKVKSFIRTFEATGSPASFQSFSGTSLSHEDRLAVVTIAQISWPESS